MAIRHRISEVDEESRMGVCSICGPVGVMIGPKYKGRSYWRCGDARKRDERSRYRTEPGVAEAQRAARFKREYGITPEQYDQMLEAQGGVCVRCGGTQVSMRLAVDHCHETGRVRGLLCGPCNTYLGRLEAEIGRLAQDLAYIGTPAATVIEERLTTEPVAGW